MPLGADFVNLTSAYNEAFILACLFSWCNPLGVGSAGFASLKTTATHLVRYVKEQRKCVAGEMAAFLKLERKEYFKEWGLLSETEGRRDAGMDRDTMGRFSGSVITTKQGQPIRTIDDVISSSRPGTLM